MAAEDYIDEFDLVNFEYESQFNDNPSNYRNFYWRSKDGRSVKVCDMTDQHLRNTALMLMGLGYQVYRCPDKVRIQWLTVFRMEWEERMKVRNLHKGVRGYIGVGDD